MFACLSVFCTPIVKKTLCQILSCGRQRQIWPNSNLFIEVKIYVGYSIYFGWAENHRFSEHPLSNSEMSCWRGFEYASCFSCRRIEPPLKKGIFWAWQLTASDGDDTVLELWECGVALYGNYSQVHFNLGPIYGSYRSVRVPFMGHINLLGSPSMAQIDLLMSHLGVI